MASCDTGKKPYEEAEALFSQSKYSAAKSRAEEVVKFSKINMRQWQRKWLKKIDKADDAIKIF